MGTSNNDQRVVGEYVQDCLRNIHQHQIASNVQLLRSDGSTPHLRTVGGMRSKGLTASLGIGRQVVQCLLLTIVPKFRPTPLPNVAELVAQYHERNDGVVEVAGYQCKVTHPLTKFRWTARTGMAQCTSKVFEDR
jgi:hypothetical protein